MKPDYLARIERLQGLMLEHSVDAVILSVGSDLPYFTGYEAMASERPTVAVVPVRGEALMFVPRLEEPRTRATPIEVRAWDETDDPLDLVASTTTPRKALVGDHMWSVFTVGLQQRWPNTEWGVASRLTQKMRTIKDSFEVESLRSAAHAVDRVMLRVPSELRFSGRTEIEVARDLRRMTVEEGHDTAEFAIVASGPNGASPHHEPSDRVIEQGDLVVCDYGGRLGGYFSDSTRTFSVGDPDEKQSEVRDAVYAASEAAKKSIGPGVPCEEVDRAARRVIEGSGLGEFFIHRTGHGIGLEVHEHPYIVSGNDSPLEVGMVFSVEPGVYIPNSLGVRIEDIVSCSEEGADSLNQAPRDLVVVE